MAVDAMWLSFWFQMLVGAEHMHVDGGHGATHAHVAILVRLKQVPKYSAGIRQPERMRFD
jgi:hypothetical protein